MSGGGVERVNVLSGLRRVLPVFFFSSFFSIVCRFPYRFFPSVLSPVGEVRGRWRLCDCLEPVEREAGCSQVSQVSLGLHVNATLCVFFPGCGMLSYDRL